jgi:hypothetical protein
LSEQLQLRRGTASQIASAAAPVQGEPWVDTTNNRIIVGDGVTVGGHPAARLDETITNYRMPIGDANYTAQVGDRLVAYTAITAARVVTLPAASAFPTGTPLRIVDESGGCTATITLTITAAGSDHINGAASAIIATAFGYLTLESDGISKWTIVGQPVAGASGMLTPSHGGLGVAASSAPYRLAALAINANVVADTAIAIPLPPGLSRYRVGRVSALNASVPLSAAQAALYTAASGGGAAVASPQALSGLTTNTPNSAGNAIDLTQALAIATFFTAATLYFRITTAQGAAATVDVVIQIEPYD